ncbi:hypothetical protein CERSUDRAFT_101788 [Gelatoporia subvermispora B]|uniref:Micro-fibrillar-associated protein 1 C-terminal domain-containing protein n=1 Tax=Ceriporiopsis subvermispora (strain B) TaxID=914234 RepID=M2RQU3_CERS8|nr:hypothetical protein CERSUDRAFT_101788 [Gelatoporia subvermispora B]
MSSASRKPAARLARPAARYWKGKAPRGADEGDVTSEEEDEYAEEAPAEEGDVPIGAIEEEEEEEDGLTLTTREQVDKRRGINVQLRDVNISKEGKVTVAGREEVGRTEVEVEEEEEEEEEAGEEEEEEEEEETSEEEESEEEKPKLQFRPVFVPKRARATVAEKEAMAQDTEEALRKKELEAEERRKQSHDMVAESIRRELLEKEKEEEVPDVDDTDGLDPAGEFEAWRLRELARIKRDKEAALARELEREEVERRRALPEEQRLREDLERAEKTRQEKPKGKQKFLQKYWHKGAFHQDEEILKRHDFTEATESTMDVSMLPKVMQVKNFGKRSRTKYTHLLDQDTTVSAGGFGGTGSVQSGGTNTAGGGCFLCGGPHLKKDCPQNKDRDLPPGQRATGANSAPQGVRQWGAKDDGRSAGGWRDRDRDDRDRRRDDRYGYDKSDRRDRSRERERGGYGDRDRYEGRRRSYSRSRSPPPRRDYERDKERWREAERRERDGGRERRRERSGEADHGGKRRRVD